MSKISLPECLARKIVIAKKKGYVITLYCSPSHNQDESEPFLSSLENLLGNIRNQDPPFTILQGDFNDWSVSQCVHDITNNEGTQRLTKGLPKACSGLQKCKHKLDSKVFKHD